MIKIPVIRRTNYTVYYENVEGNTFVHCDCYRWNKKIKQQLMKDLDTLKEMHKGNWYALNTFNDTKRYKFLNLMNFNFLKEIIGTDGNKHQIFVRT